MAINILDDNIINQIAAGEVIENPSAVVKELVENSIDSGANLIEVELENFGLDKIIITDNGCGISYEDLKKAPLRHATSKISNFNDLYSIKTMGFRGEALASIFSVSKAKIVSKQENKEVYEISSDNIEEIKTSGGQKGTKIFVEEIFYNTPARKKYLKSNNSELKTITEVMMRFCVYYHNIKFVLKHNSKVLINKPKFEKKEDNLYYILGSDLKNNLLELNFEVEGIKLCGFIGKPSNITYSYKKNQYLFVNGRYVKSKLISDAIYEGFGTNLMEARHPFFTLFIDIDPEIIDVNVHPTKIEIRFENELEIYEFVKKSIKEVFLRNETTKPFEEQIIKTRDYSLGEVGVNINENSNLNLDKKNIENKNYYTQDVQKSFEVAEEEVVYQKSPNYNIERKDSVIENIQQQQNNKENLINDNNSNNKINIEIENKNLSIINQEEIEENINLKNDIIPKEQYGPLYEILSDYKIVGQIHKTYFIVETKNEMFLIDQHAAEEKVFYEKFLTEYENQKISYQNLLKPEILKLNPQELINFDENKKFLEKLGFYCENFGNSEIIVRAVPIDFRKQPINPKSILDVLGELDITKKSKSQEIEKVEKIASKSCRTAIKAGHEMTTPEIKNLIEEMKRLKEPFNCPHGRPVILRWTWYELEKKFKRIV